MEKNTLPLAAVPFKFIAPMTEIISIAFLLIFLMTCSLQFLSPTWILTAAIAVFLSFMIEEDAYEQTIDLVFLFIVAALMLFISVFHGYEQLFIKQMIIGTCFFRFLLVLTSLWLTCRPSAAAVLNRIQQEDDPLNLKNETIGYLPVFAIVFILYLGFGETFAPFVFSGIFFAITVLEDLIDFYPSLPYIGLILWFICEKILWEIKHKKRQQIIWAFGGGDVLFLGIFAGYLGLSPLFSLFFLSLIARIIFSLLQLFIKPLHKSI